MRDEYLRAARGCLHLRDECRLPEARQFFERVAQSYLALAEQESWLAGEVNPMRELLPASL